MDQTQTGGAFEAPDADRPRPAPVRDLTVADIRWALEKGWDDFRALRGDFLFLPVVYAALGFAASALAFHQTLFALIFPLAGGFALVGPIAAAGFYELARRREQGMDTTWFHFFDPMRGPQRFPLLMLSIVLAGLFLMWMTVAQGIYANTLGRLAPDGVADFLAKLFTTPEGWTMIIAGNLAGAGFALAALVIGAFSFPMAVDKACDPFVAILTSVSAFLHNPATMLRWGAVVAALLVAGSIPLFLGLMLVLPWLGYSTWHLYTRAVVR
jgi:uncharacterized membrane protein